MNLLMNIPLLAVSKVFAIPLAIMCVVVLCSPAIQINLSTKKNKYVGLIFPAIVFAFFLVIVIVFRPNIVVSILMVAVAPAALVAFHIIIRKNLRY